MNKMYYFGYGMNTNVGGMRSRCPAATSMGAAVLQDYEFRFARHADIVPQPGERVVGVLWQITDRCLQSLDRLEGCHIDRQGNIDQHSYYGRRQVPILHHGVTYDAWVYYMLPGMPIEPPDQSYWDCLIEGYREHDVSRRQLYRALETSETAISIIV